jgi:chaperonin GroES
MVQQTEKKLSIRPLGNRVVAQHLEQKETLKGGLVLPEKKPETAKVVAVGPGALNKEGKNLPMPVQVGDTILMDKYAGQEITLDDEQFVIVKADDIIAIVN